MRQCSPPGSPLLQEGVDRNVVVVPARVSHWGATSGPMRADSRCPDGQRRTPHGEVNSHECRRVRVQRQQHSARTSTSRTTSSAMSESTIAETVGLASAERRAKSLRVSVPSRRISSRSSARFVSRTVRVPALPPSCFRSDCIYPVTPPMKPATLGRKNRCAPARFGSRHGVPLECRFSRARGDSRAHGRLMRQG